MKNILLQWRAELFVCVAVWLSASGVLAQSPPSIAKEPAGANVFVGMRVLLQVAASGTAPLAYQWQLNGLDIAGANATNLALPFAHPANGGQYRVEVSNAFGSVTSSIAVLNVVGPLVEWGYADAMTTYPPPQGTNFTAIAGSAWGDNFLALRDDGTVVDWGDSARAETNMPAGLSNIVGISTGRFHSLALQRNGTVVAWGDDSFGACDVPLGLSNVVAIAAGGGINYQECSFSLALETNGTVVSWGADPGQPDVPTGLCNVAAIAAGNNFALALKSDGTVTAWGDDELGQTDVPSGLSNIVQVTAGGWFSLALRNDGHVFGWGENYYGQTAVPTNLSNVVAIATGYYQSIALRQDGTVICWGDGGAYNDGASSPPYGLTNVVGIAGNVDYSFALLSDGPPYFTVSPFSQSVASGATITFTSFAVGPGPISYQWQFNGSNIGWATNENLVLTPVALTDAGIYQCVVSNPLASAASSPAALTVYRSTPWFEVSRSSLGFTNGGFDLSLQSLSGHGTIIIFASTNLEDWTPIFTNPPVLGTLKFRDPEAKNILSRFYRAVEQ